MADVTEVKRRATGVQVVFITLYESRDEDKRTRLKGQMDTFLNKSESNLKRKRFLQRNILNSLQLQFIVITALHDNIFNKNIINKIKINTS